MAQHTAEELAKWIAQYTKKKGRGPEVLSSFFDERKPKLQRRVNIFLHRFDNFGERLVDDEDGDNLKSLVVYNLFKGWASTLVGYDAPQEDIIDGGYDVLMGYVIKKLGL